MFESEEYTIESFNELIDIFDKTLIVNKQVGEDIYHSEFPLIYRGMSNVEWVLKASVGRLENYSINLEREMLKLFKIGARPHLKIEPRNDWEWISLAQHHGLPTRILDWTKNPLVAVFFAVEDECETDSVVYAMPAPEVISTEKFSPLEYDRDETVFLPEHITPRIIAQQGQFTIHKTPNQAVGGWFRKIIIPNNLRQIMKYRISRFGIDYSTLFPGLDGLAKSIRWDKTGDKTELLEFMLNKNA